MDRTVWRPAAGIRDGGVAGAPSFALPSPATNAIGSTYLNGTLTAPNPGLTGGTLTFRLPMTPGTYEVRFFLNSSDRKRAAKGKIVVAAQSGAVKKTTEGIGQKVMATGANG